jgi:hypothetical protein
MSFALVDPGTLRATLFWFAVVVFFAGFSSEFSVFFLQVMGLLLMISIPTEVFGRRAREIRRLYLQFPKLSRSQFLMQVGWFHCAIGVVAILIGGLLILSAELLVETGLVVESLALGLLGYSLITATFLLFNMLRLELNVFFRGVITVSICMFCVATYVLLRIEVFFLGQWLLVFAGIAGYLLMLLSFYLWSRADIEL